MVKGLAVVIALVLMMGTVAGGTIAWMTDQSDVTDTFTFGNVDIRLNESLVDSDNNVVKKDGEPVRIEGKQDKLGYTNLYNIYPGETIFKDPMVTVSANSEDCWVFIRIKEKFGDVKIDGRALDFEDFLQYEVITDQNTADKDCWIPLKGYCDPDDEEPDEFVYYRKVLKSETGEDQTFDIIKGNEVKVPDDVDSEMLNALLLALETEQDEEFPMLVITAYAIQYSDDVLNVKTAYRAWATLEGIDYNDLPYKPETDEEEIPLRLSEPA